MAGVPVPGPVRGRDSINLKIDLDTGTHAIWVNTSKPFGSSSTSDSSPSISGVPLRPPSKALKLTQPRKLQHSTHVRRREIAMYPTKLPINIHTCSCISTEYLE